MEISIDWVQVITNLVVAGGSAWVGGKLGVRRALEQVKRERAFDRQLEWYENAFRVAMEFRYLTEDVAIAVRGHRDDVWQKVLGRSGKVLEALKEKINESLLFSKKNTYLLLKTLFADIHHKMAETGEMITRGVSTETTASQYDNLAKLSERVAFELAKSTRQHLGMDEITLEDFEK